MRLQILLLFFISLTSVGSLQASRIHQLIADANQKDKSIQTFLRRSNRCVNEIDIVDGHSITVLEHAARMGRWPLVLWILNYFPHIDVNRRGFFLSYLPLLGYATMMHQPVADDILDVRNDALVGRSQEEIKWQYTEHPFLEAAARYGNWDQFGKWLDRFPEARVSSSFSNSATIPSEPRIPVMKSNTILAHLILADQRELIGRVLVNHIPNDQATNSRLIELIGTLIPVHTKRAILLDLMRRDPRTFAIDSDWMSFHPMVISLRKLFEDACSQNLLGNFYTHDAFEFIRLNDPDLASFGKDFILSALAAKNREAQQGRPAELITSLVFSVVFAAASQSSNYQ